MANILKALTFGKVSSRHKKLPEEWGEGIKQPVNDGMIFYVKYLGSTLVDQPSSDTATAEAIKSIISMAKLSGKKLPRVSLTVKPSGLTTLDISSGEILHDISIYRISYCSADATSERVVAFIATNKNETMECHAFLTSKRKMAQAAALTISQAFTIAFENWQASKASTTSSTPTKSSANGNSSALKDRNQNNKSLQLIDLSFEEPVTNDNGKVDSLDVPFDNDLDDSFSKLATSRSRPQLENASNDPFQVPDTVLPTNVQSIDMDDELSFFFTSRGQASRDGDFFNQKDDLFAL